MSANRFADIPNQATNTVLCINVFRQVEVKINDFVGNIHLKPTVIVSPTSTINHYLIIGKLVRNNLSI